MPDLSLVRKWRIQNLEKGLQKLKDSNSTSYGVMRSLEKEIQIQKAYLYIEGL